MAKRFKKSKFKDVEYDFYAILDSVTDEKEKKDTICVFHKKGKNPMCIGCEQEEDTLDECIVDAMNKLLKKPDFAKKGEVWNPKFDLPVVKSRIERVLANDTIGIGLICNTCHISDNCPVYAEDHECGVDWKEGIDTSDPKEVINYLIDIQTERVSRARKMELIDGGMPDQTTSGEMDRLTGMIEAKDNLDADRFSMRIDAKGKSAEGGGGILSKLFASPDTKEIPEKVEGGETIDIPLIEEETVKLKAENSK